MNPTIISPNTVLANTLGQVVDLIRPRYVYSKPRSIVFVVGTQINGTPHLGTHITQCSAFLLAEIARSVFKVDTSVLFGALDNAPHDIILDPESHHAYQITYHHKLGRDGIKSLVDEFYRDFFEGLSDRTSVDYQIQTYTEQQYSSEYRMEFIKSLSNIEKIRWCLSPTSGIFHVRLPCPECKFAEKRAERTKLLGYSKTKAEFESYCFDHGPYNSILKDNSDCYLDINTLYRNVIKEAVLAKTPNTLYVIIKGGDWAYGVQLVDWALSALGYKLIDLPMRIFTPQVLVDTGAKLSKSLIKRGSMNLSKNSESWMLEATDWGESKESYIDLLLWIVEKLMDDPKHFYRSYTDKELQRIMKYGKSSLQKIKRHRTIRIYKKYFEMIADGVKTIEIRVGYSSMRKIKQGQLLKFVSQTKECLTRVVRATEYRSFRELFDNEDAKRINPYDSKEKQLEEISKIFPTNKEALGVLCFEIQKDTGK